MPDSKAVSADVARTRLMKILVDGVVNEDFPCLFFASIEKMPADLNGAYMAVTITKRGPLLIYDREFVATAPREHILITLEHELYHLVFEHFMRSIEIAAELNMEYSEYMRSVAPFADVVVNEWVRKSNRPGYKELSESLLTYDSPVCVGMGITRNDQTYEEVARKVAHQLTNGNKIAGRVRVVVVSTPQDGSVEVNSADNDEGKDGSVTVSVPNIDEDTAEGQRESVAKLIQESSRMAGNVPEEMRRLIDEFAKDATPMVRALKGWELFRHVLVGERTSGRDRERTFGRLNRRTLLPPGRKEEGAYIALFIVDESGSVGDDEVMIAHNTIVSCITQSSSDKVYVLPYDTEPGELREATATGNYERTKCGGTDFVDMFTNKVVRDLDYDIAIILTDGYPSRFPQKHSGRPEVWLITDESGYRQWKEHYNHGIGILV